MKVFYADERTVNYFPSNLCEIFPNLEMLVIFHSGLKDISSRDLKNLNNLEILWIENNDLKVIDADLFVNNPKLEFIAISSNKITRVNFGAFSHLQNLEKLFFEYNPCQSTLATNRDSVKKLIEDIHNNCKA